MEKSIDRDDYQDTPRPLAGMAKDFADGFRIEPHSHPRAQLTWAVFGVMTVTAARGSWVVPPNRALWIPAETEHAIRMSGPVGMRAIYVDAIVAGTVAAKCKVILVSPLLRALMLELVAAPLDYDEAGRMGHVAALFLDEIRVLDAQPLHIPMPNDGRLRRVCEALLRDPASTRLSRQWSAHRRRQQPHPGAAVRARNRHGLCRLAQPGAARRRIGAGWRKGRMSPQSRAPSAIAAPALLPRCFAKPSARRHAIIFA